MNLTPDQILVPLGPITLNATLLYTWFVMGVLTLISWWITRRLSAATHISPGQNLLEVLVLGIANQIRDISEQEPEPYLPFVGTLFVFIAASNLLGILPGYQPPTGSLSTTTALAICVFVAVPLFGIRQQGLRSYLKQYLQPTPIMLPFNLISDVSRILSLAVRLFGNVMSGTMIVAILLSIAPLVFPVVMQAFGLLTGLIQAYIFAVLAMVFIAAATGGERGRERVGDGMGGASEVIEF
jgi:F-type H+-transporting ATPase subunit a